MLGLILGVGMAAACPRVPPRVVTTANFTMPEGAHPTRDALRFVVDIGSEGRLRRWALIESSGDAALDAAAEAALPELRFAPPSLGCVSLSASVPWSWRIPAEMIASPTTASAEPKPGAAPVACTAPFVQVNRLMLGAKRQSPGAVSVDVSLDANAHVTSVRLVHPSGNIKTDYAATIAARTSTYAYLPIPSCPARPTTYHLELGFH